MLQDTELSAPRGLIAGKYRLARLLGRGGMGAVWEGTHSSLGTRVAVKFIDAEYAESPEARSRFENEARAAAKLRSKHVVEVYDHGVSEDGRPFIVMEFLQGEPLDKRLDRVGRMSAKETARIIVQICRGLTKAHTANIVHRDLKPENVFLVWDDEEGTDVAKVVDFGIAKFTDASLGSSSSTRTGSVLGTPHYMSPEQARGLRNLDYRSDLWSVAVIAYRCIVGSLPFEGEAVGDLLVKLCTAPIPLPSQIASGVPPGFDAWLFKALSRDPGQRFNSAAQLAESLAAVCGLSVRGSYASAEIPPTWDGSTGPNGVIGSGAQVAFSASRGSALPVGAAGIALSTGAPTTRTAGLSNRTGAGALIAASIAALVVLGIGGAVVVKKLRAHSDPGSAAAMPVPPLSPLPTSVPAPVVPLEHAASAATRAPLPPIADVAPLARAAKGTPKAVARAPAKASAPARTAADPPPAPRRDSDIGF